MYFDVLKVLAQQGPLKLSHITCKANFNCSALKECLDFLLQQGLVEKRIVKRGQTVYGNTPRGVAVLKYFKELNKALPIIEEKTNVHFILEKQTNQPRMYVE